MIDPVLLAALTGIVGAIGAMVWSFLMASKVAAPRAAEKSKLLLVSILTGATPEDKEILEEVRGSLVRPEVENAFAALAEKLPDDIAEHMDMHFKAIQGAESKAMSNLLQEMNIEGVSEEMKQVALQKMTMGQRATAKVLTMKIPRATREAHPIGAAFFDTFKQELAETIAGMTSGEGGNVSVENRSDNNWNPGVRR